LHPTPLHKNIIKALKVSSVKNPKKGTALVCYFYKHTCLIKMNKIFNKKTVIPVIVLIIAVICTVLFNESNMDIKEQLIEQFNFGRTEDTVIDILFSGDLLNTDKSDGEMQYLCVAENILDQVEVIYYHKNKSGITRILNKKFDVQSLLESQVYSINIDKDTDIEFGFTKDISESRITYNGESINVHIIDISDISNLQKIGFWYAMK